MERKRKVLISSGLAAALAALAVTVACSDTAVEPKGALPTDASAAVSGRGAERRALSRSELRARNQLDWVGQAHNTLLDAAIKEVKRPGARLGNMCAAVQRAFADPRSWGRYADRLPPGVAADIRAGLKESAACNDDRRREISGTRRGRGRNAALVQDGSVSPQAEVMLGDIITAAENSSTPAELDAQLSTIAQDAAGTTGNDSILVHGAIAVAQGSSEYWSNPANLQPLLAAAENDLAQCQAGNSEGMTIEADGVTYQCSGSEWRQVSAPASKRSAVFQLASFPGTNGTPHAQSAYEILGIPHPCDLRFGWILSWDVKAFGGASPFVIALKLKGLAIAVAIGAGGSYVAAAVEMYRVAICRAR